ncbi:MAG TPA: DMT family transporter [Dissulfurispiraceae bacterium]
MPLRVYIVLGIAVLSQAAGNVFLSMGMRQIASACYGEDGLISIPFQAILSPVIWIGIAFSILFYLLFAAALSWTDLSFVMPVISLQVVMNVAFAELFLGEHVSPVRWGGVVLIAVGVILVLRSGRQAAEEERGERKGK